jgi:hypothetical protein
MTTFLTRPDFLQFLRGHSALFETEARAAAARRAIVDPAHLRSWVASYQSHVVVRLAKMISDPRWDFGIVRASAANREWRDNERAKATSPVKHPVRLPYPTKQVYFRHFTYVVARCGATEVVDMNLSVWKDADRGVSIEPLSWDVYTEDSDATGLRNLQGAEWITYHVFPLPPEERKAYPALTESVGLQIDEMLRSLELEIPKG